MGVTAYEPLADSDAPLAYRATSMAVQRVLIVTGWFPTARNPVGGVFVRRQAEALADVGMSVRVLHLRSGRGVAEPTPWRGDRDLAVETVFVPKLPLRALGEMVAVVRVLRSIRRFQPDVIHAHVFDVGLAAVVAGRLARLPVVVTEHWTRLLRGLRWFERPRARLVYRRADSVVAVGNALAHRIDDLSGRHDVAVVPNVVVTSGPIGRREGESPPFQLATVGSLIALKGHATLVDAVTVLVHERGLDVRLTVVGDGPEIEALRAQAAENAIAHVVEFVGRVDPSGVEEILRNSHVFVLPSRYETFSVATAEALSIGLPVVVTRCGGPEDFVGPQDGVIVPVDDVEALSDGIVEVCGSLNRWDAEAIASRARGRFAPGAVASCLVHLFESVKR